MNGSSDDSVSDGVVFGAATAMALWGLAVVVASAGFHTELVPDSTGFAMGIIGVVTLVGAVLGAGAAAKARR